MAGRALVLGLHIRHFRNIEELLIRPAPGLNLISGDNGHGKTSLIEALYVLATTRSFRSSKLSEVVAEGAGQTQILGQVSTLGLPREQRASLSVRGRSFLIDGKKPKRAVDYARAAPIVVFHPGELSLVSGSGAQRRTLLDRLALYLDPPGAEARINLQRASRERQVLLDRRGTQAKELDAFERVIAEQGARLAVCRRRCLERLSQELLPAFLRMGPENLGVGCSYVPGGTEDPEAFARELALRRPRDLRRGAMTFGPQRDEIALSVGSRPARSHASQGQQRLLTLALKLAELACVREATGLDPILLLDDISSELDPRRTESVFQFLRQAKSQVFVTTTRPELFDQVEVEPSQRANFRMQAGQLIELPA